MTEPTPPAPQRSLLARIISLEGFIALAGIFLLISGLSTGATIAIFWGVMAIAGLFGLHFVRKKDWKAHWEAMERQQSASSGRGPSQEDSDRGA